MFYNATLERTVFIDAKLNGADFRRARLTDAKFSGACIEGAQFADAEGIPAEVSALLDGNQTGMRRAKVG